MKTGSLSDFKISLTSMIVSAKMKFNRKFQISLHLWCDQVFSSNWPNWVKVFG